MCWRLLIEESGPELIYIKGKHNIAADALSWLPSLTPYIDLQLFKKYNFDEEELPVDAFPELPMHILLRNKKKRSSFN
jgi:hypothetical protein